MVMSPYEWKFSSGRKPPKQTNKQEAHGPHPSPEKPVISATLWLYHNGDKERRKTTISFLRTECSIILKPKDALCQVWMKLAQWFLRRRFFLISSMYFRYFVIISPLKNAWPFIWTNLNLLHPRMLYANFGWNWPSGSGEEDFQVLSMYFLYFSFISPWTNLNLLHPTILCAKFCWNWPSGFGEDCFKDIVQIVQKDSFIRNSDSIKSFPLWCPRYWYSNYVFIQNRQYLMYFVNFFNLLIFSCRKYCTKQIVMSRSEYISISGHTSRDLRITPGRCRNA